MGRTPRRLIEIVAVVWVIAVLAGIFIPPIHGGKVRANVRCANNLGILYLLARIYAATLPGDWPSSQGGEFWLFLAETKPPLILVEEMEIFGCPVLGEDPSFDKSDYRGPRLPWHELKDSDPVAADKPGNHGPGEGGYVVLKNGNVLEVAAEHPLWKKCALLLR